MKRKFVYSFFLNIGVLHSESGILHFFEVRWIYSDWAEVQV